MTPERLKELRRYTTDCANSTIIAELFDEIDALREQLRWRSMKDEPPKWEDSPIVIVSDELYPRVFEWDKVEKVWQAADMQCLSGYNFWRPLTPPAENTKGAEDGKENN